MDQQASLISLKNTQLTSSQGTFRWLDVADQKYGEKFRESYSYSQAQVFLSYNTTGPLLRVKLLGHLLKPNFAYQLKLVGKPEHSSNELLGQIGRHWQETWDGKQWDDGHNLNDKGSGFASTPNDETYHNLREIVDPTSPTGRKHRFTHYLLFDYFVTDVNGSVSLQTSVCSSFHVLFKLEQRTPDQNESIRVYAVHRPDSDSSFFYAYPENFFFSPLQVSLFAEWERLPLEEQKLRLGKYDVKLLLTEESFHGDVDHLAGQWPAVMGVDTEFTITTE